MNEKGGEIFKGKISEKLNSYLETNYSNLKIAKEEIQYNNKEFTQKITSSTNKNLYFYITYKNKEIIDTYKEDYEEGNSLLTYLNKKLEEEIKKRTNIECKVHSINKLNEYSEKVQERLMKEDNLLELKYYYVEKEFTIKEWTKENITEEISKFLKEMQDENITPKYYEIIITKEDEITTSIRISNLTESFLELEEKEEIIQNILEDKNSNLLKENKISYEYEN